MTISKISSKHLVWLMMLAGCSVENPSIPLQGQVDQKAENDSAQEIPFLNACACKMTVDWSQINEYTDGSALDPTSDINAIYILVFDLSKSDYVAMANGELGRYYNNLDYVTFQPVYGETSGSLDTSLYDSKVMAIRVSAEEDSMLISALYEISSAVSENTITLEK